MGFIFQDLRHGARFLLRRPRGPFLTILVLALGIGLATAMFGVLDGVLLRGLPFPQGDRIVLVTTSDRGADAPMPAADFRFLDEHLAAMPEFAGLAAFQTFNSVITRPGAGSKGLTATYVGGDLFELLGVRALLGRRFTPEDEDPAAPAVAMISHAVWQTQFGGDPQVLGQTLLFNREAMTIVGVMPPGFEFPVRQQAWAVRRPGQPWFEAPVFAVARLRPGVRTGEAESAGKAVLARLEAEFPGPPGAERRLVVAAYAETLLPPPIRDSLRLLLWAVCGVLLIACANAANLRLAGALARTRELEIRRALGARTLSLLRLLVAEALLLTAAAMLAGIGFAWLLLRLAGAFLLQGSFLVHQFWIDVRFDLRSALFAAAMAGVAVMLGGLLPALWSLRRRGLPASGRTTGRRGTLRLVETLVSGEVALSFALLAASGLLVLSGLSVLGRETGFDSRHLLRTLVSTYQAEEGAASAESRRAFWDRLLPRLEAAPEVLGASLVSSVPWGAPPRAAVQVASEDDSAAADRPTAEVLSVLPGFFETLGLPLEAGRGFDPGDVVMTAEPQPLPVVVSASFVRRHLAGAFLGDAIGRSFGILDASGSRPSVTATVIGVAADRGSSDEGQPGAEDAIYRPFSFAQSGGGFLLLRGRAGTEGLMKVVEREVAGLDPRVATLDDRTFEQERAERLWVERRLAQLFSLFAVVALLLSAIGLFGSVTLALQGRLREFAIRAAVGARPRHLRQLVLAQGLRAVAAGLGAGTLLLALGHRSLGAFLHGVESWHPPLLAATALALTAVLLASLHGPARRAARTDPAKVLAQE